MQDELHQLLCRAREAQGTPHYQEAVQEFVDACELPIQQADDATRSSRREEAMRLCRIRREVCQRVGKVLPRARIDDPGHWVRWIVRDVMADDLFDRGQQAPEGPERDREIRRLLHFCDEDISDVLRKIQDADIMREDDTILELLLEKVRRALPSSKKGNSRAWVRTIVRHICRDQQRKLQAMGRTRPLDSAEVGDLPGTHGVEGEVVIQLQENLFRCRCEVVRETIEADHGRHGVNPLDWQIFLRTYFGNWGDPAEGEAYAVGSCEPRDTVLQKVATLFRVTPEHVREANARARRIYAEMWCVDAETTADLFTEVQHKVAVGMHAHLVEEILRTGGYLDDAIRDGLDQFLKECMAQTPARNPRRERAVEGFRLYAQDGWPMGKIARHLGKATGTIASDLKMMEEEFIQFVTRYLREHPSQTNLLSPYFAVQHIRN